MDPRDVNRINYNNYYAGQNLDFLIRSKMRSESLSTPLTNTPVSYDDQVSSKMALLGKRGYYDPGNIYDFNSNSNQNSINYNNNEQINNNKAQFDSKKGIMNNSQNDEFRKEYFDYINNKNKVVMNNEMDNTKNRYNINLLKTKEQIQHEVCLENYKNHQLAEQMNREEYMKYKHNLFRK